MKREDISKIFEGATEEQINQLLNINSADIGSAKKKLEAERDGYKEQLSTAQEALKKFEARSQSSQAPLQRRRQSTSRSCPTWSLTRRWRLPSGAARPGMSRL